MYSNKYRYQFFTLLVFVSCVSIIHADVLLQSESRERFSDVAFPFFFIEAEDFHDNNPRDDGEAWLLSSDPLALAETVEPELEPDPGAFASGGESITNTIQSLATNDFGGQHDVQYLIQFDQPGTYHLYIRQHSPLGHENNRNRNDSFYYPINFGESPDQNKANGDDYGLLESIEAPGDTFVRGPWLWFAARNQVEASEADPPIDQNESTFLEWEITEEMVGENQILEFDHRETGTMLDAFLFIDAFSGIPPTSGLGPDGTGFKGVGDIVDLVFGLTNLGAMSCDIDGDSVCGVGDLNIINGAIQDGGNDSRFDLNSDGVVDVGDRDDFLRQIESLPGDATLSGVSDAADLNAIGTNWLTNHGSPSWEKGDFNGDGITDANDLNTLGIWWQKTAEDFAAAEGAAASAVPEPSSIVMLVLSMLCLAATRRKIDD